MKFFVRVSGFFVTRMRFFKVAQVARGGESKRERENMQKKKKKHTTSLKLIAGVMSDGDFVCGIAQCTSTTAQGCTAGPEPACKW